MVLKMDAIAVGGKSRAVGEVFAAFFDQRKKVVGICSLLCGKATQYCIVMQWLVLRRLYCIVFSTTTQQRNHATTQRNMTIASSSGALPVLLGVGVRSQGHWCRSDRLQLEWKQIVSLRSVSIVTRR
jgi:hypothetical protein